MLLFGLPNFPWIIWYFSLFFPLHESHFIPCFMPGLWFPTDRFAFTRSYLPQINLKHIASELWKTSAESQCPWNMNQQFTGTPGFSSVTKKRHLHLIFTSHILCHIWWKALGIMGRYFTNCFDLPGGEGGSFSIKKKCCLILTEIVKLFPFGNLRKRRKVN